MDCQSPQPQLAYQWVWADAASRTAQNTTQADVGRRGYQSDIRLAFELQSVSPAVWAPLPDPLMFAPSRGWRVLSTTNSFNGFGISVSNLGGTATARAPTLTSVGERQNRVGYVSSALALNICGARTGALANNIPWRASTRFVWTPGASTVGRYFVGTCSSTNVLANADPASFTNCFGVSKLGTAGGNLQLLRNDGSGVASALDLGAGFPANTTNIAFEILMAYFGSSQYAINIMNLVNRSEISFSFNTDVPDGSNNNVFAYYANNNTDAVAVEIGIGDLDWNNRTER